MSAYNFLPEHPILIINAIPESGHAHGCQRLQKTCSQSPQASIAQPGIRLGFQDFIQNYAVVLLQNGAALFI